ncbi:MAG: hypothetical protein MUC71_11740 [Steroidobacteraceae bacterium]|jgi:hypothetical protein|nr:hypothetical protein [Steroidobacteraceae bacterium]
MRRSLGVVLILAITAAGARAETGQAQLSVQATVPARVTLEAVEHPDRLDLSQADIERGYKQVSARYVVRENTARGWLLRLSPRIGLTRHVEIHGLSRPLLLQADSVEVYQPPARGAQALALDYRFVLDPDARPGSYALPIHISATPL